MGAVRSLCALLLRSGRAQLFQRTRARVRGLLALQLSFADGAKAVKMQRQAKTGRCDRCDSATTQDGYMQHGLRAGSAVNHEKPVLRVRAGAGVPRARRPGVRRLLVRAADVGDEVLAARTSLVGVSRQAGSRDGGGEGELTGGRCSRRTACGRWPHSQTCSGCRETFEVSETTLQPTTSNKSKGNKARESDRPY